MRLVLEYRRPLVLGLAAVCFLAGAAHAQAPTLAERIQTCSACHGEDGNSKLENIPSIAGQPDFFILNQLVLMREKVRQVEAMAEVVKDLKDDDINALAAHFSRLPAKASDEKIDPALVRRGTEIANQKRCVSCHGAALEGSQQIPRVAKQRIDYLIKSLKEFRDGTRPGSDTIMGQPVSGLSDADLAALAHYAAGK